MRIGFVGPVPPIRGGIAHHSARVIEALRELEHEVVVHSWRSQYPRLLYRRSERDDGAVTFPGVSWSLRWWDPTSWIRVGRDLRRVDRIVMPWTVPVHGPHYLSVMWAARVPVSIHVHNVFPHEPIPASRWMAKRVLGRADRLVTHASSVARDCAGLLGTDSAVMVAHPPDLPVVRRPAPALPLRLLALGYLREYKGTDLAMRAVARLAEAGSEVTLTVAGEPWDRGPGPWHDLVDELGVADRVSLRLSYQSDEEVAELIASHHALIAPYRSATQSGVVAQALAAGRPVVATTVGGLPDVVREGENGALARPNDVESLADAIARLQRNLPALTAGAEATNASWQQVAAALLAD